MNKQELIPRAWVGESVGGLLAGLNAVLVGVALLTLIYSGVLAPHLPFGMTLSLIGAAVFILAIALLSSLPTHMGSLQEQAAAILGTLSLALTAAVQSEDVAAEDALSTMLAILVLAALLYGGSLFLIGRFRLGKLTQFIPFPVIAGFLAGTGWLVLEAGLTSLTNVSIRLDTLADLPAKAAFWSPALLAAVALFFLTRLFPTPLTLSGALVTLLIGFYTVALLSGATIEELQEDNWLFGPFPKEDSGRSLSQLSLANVDIGFVLSTLPSLATLVLLCTLDCLLNLTALEIGIGRELDLDSELRASGLANLLVAGCGSVTGSTDLGSSLTLHRTGVATRWPGLVSAAFCFGIALLGPAIIGFVPKMLLGTIIFSVALELLVQWLYQSAEKMTRAEYAIVWAIFGSIIAIGFLEGILIGVVISILVFIVNYSRISPMKSSASLATTRSSVARSQGELAILASGGDAVVVLKLQGFLFFGTASALLAEVKKRVTPLAGRRSYVLIDFKAVNGIDASAGFLFTKMRQFLDREQSTLVLTALSAQVQAVLAKSGVLAGEIAVFGDLDYALEWAENQVLTAVGFHADRHPIADQLAARLGDMTKAEMLLRYLEVMDCAAGETVIRQGDSTTDVYFIESGHLSAVLDIGGKTLRLRKFGPGALFGEMAVYLGERRTASVVADTAARLHRLTPAALARLTAEDPRAEAVFHELMARTMAERIAFQNRQLASQ